VGEDFKVATPKVAAGVLVRDERGAVLLVKPTYKEGWDLPGGYVEPGESPRRAAGREVFEELGIRTTIGRLLTVDWAPHPAEGDKLLFVFEAPWIDLRDVHKEADEIGEVAYVPPAGLGDRLPTRLFDRVTAALREDADVYLEHGRQKD
jgi:ADP-ribose pyrophosphatase YjhB (NUDIX family)